MRHVPSRVLDGELCMENFLPLVLERSLRAFFHLFFPTYQGQRDCAAAFNPPRICRGPHIAAAGEVAASSPSAAAFQRWQQMPLYHPSPQPEVGGAEPEAAFAARPMNFQLPARLATV